MEPDFAAAQRAFSLRSVGITVLLAIAVALLLNPIFDLPLVLLLGRTLFVAMMLLLAYAAATRWRLRWLRRGAAQAIAVALTAPLATLAVYMVAVDGDIAAFLNHEGRVEGFFFIAGSGMFVGLLLTVTALYRERDAQARAESLRFALEKSTLERQALDARLATLQAQIEPHFLFNTLANVQALVESGSPRAAPVLQSLIAYLRSTMPRLSQADATLGAEARRVQAYLALMQMRMPDRLSFTVTVDPSLESMRFPPMALLTLVENAIRHGIDPSEQGGVVEIEARRPTAGECLIRVTDSGVGMQESSAAGTGLRNLRERLEVFFAGRARLELSDNPPHGLRADIIVEGSES